MCFDFNDVINDEELSRDEIVDRFIKEQILEHGESGTYCFNDLLSYEWEGIQYVERLLKKSGIPSSYTHIWKINNITPKYYRDFKNGETEEQFQKRYSETAENLMIKNVAAPLITLTANALYHLKKGYLSIEEESRCPRDQMHKLFLEDKSNKSEYKFIDFPGYFYYSSKYADVAIVILKVQYDEEEKIQLPIDIKNKNVILFDTQLFTMLSLNNGNKKVGTYELPRFKGIYKFNPEISSYTRNEFKIDVPLDIWEHFSKKGV